MVTDHKLQRVLTRFPWRRRKPRARGGRSPIGYRTRDGQQLWADPKDLAEFDDPGPALVCVALRTDELGHSLVCALVEYHAVFRGLPQIDAGPDGTRAGLDLLDTLMDDAGLDPGAAVGSHAIRELLVATWAVAAGAQH